MTSTNANCDSTIAAAAAAAAGPIVASEISSETRHDTATTKKSHQVAASASTAALHENIDDVAWAFVEQYYMILHSDPDRLHLFYNKDSTAIHGIEAHTSKHAIGQQEIHKLITNDKFKSCKVMISNIDCQKTFGNGVLIQVIGEMANEGQPAQKFIQSFLLAPQNAGYYVHNDVLRFLKEDAGSEYEFSEDIASDATTPAVEELVAVVSEDKKEEVKPQPKVEKPAEPEQITEPAPLAPVAEAKSALVVEAKSTEAKPVEAESTKMTENLTEKPAEKSAAASAKKPVASAIPPALPATPMSWAARAAVKPVSTPAAPAVNGTTVPAPTPASVAAPALAPVATSSTANVQGHRRGPREFFSAYIKHVTENVQEKALKQALQDIGTVTHFEVARAKNCAFVDFVDLETLKKALAVHELKVGNSVVLIEERKRGGAKKNNGNISSHNNNNAYGRRNNSGSNGKRRTNA
ncbi:hypothetical protein D0Z03_002801 [Geotrichum reessii]|nr:hypothetical protein D0Z03_002801 [Galactomyces reessii]